MLDIELSPSEFWMMSPREFWLLYHSKIDRTKRAAGKLTDGDYDELLEMLEMLENNENG